MTTGDIVIIVYALLLLAGGWIGFAKAGSRPSLIAGSASAVVLVVALLISLLASPAAGYWTAAVVALLMCVAFSMRLRKTRTFMPSGMLLVLSLAALVAFVSFAWNVGATEASMSSLDSPSGSSSG